MLRISRARSVAKTSQGAGRPFSVAVTERLHDAFWDAVSESSTPPTIEQIATRAGVSRPALYRRYASIGELALDALLVVGASGIPMNFSDDVNDDLCKYFEKLVNVLEPGKPTSRALGFVLSRSLEDDTFAPKFYSFLQRRREPVRARVASWNKKLRDNEIEAVLDNVFGPILYRILIRKEPVDSKRVALIVKAAIAIHT